MFSARSLKNCINSAPHFRAPRYTYVKCAILYICLTLATVRSNVIKTYLLRANVVNRRRLLINGDGFSIQLYTDGKPNVIIDSWNIFSASNTTLKKISKKNLLEKSEREIRKRVKEGKEWRKLTILKRQTDVFENREEESINLYISRRRVDSFFNSCTLDILH